MSTTRQAPESGLFTGYAGFYRETTQGEFDADPDYLLFADDLMGVTVAPGAGRDARHILGTANPGGHESQHEEGTVTISYWLQQALVDGSDDLLDASADAVFRNVDNRIDNTHSLRIEEVRETSSADDPDGTAGARVYTIAKGAHPNVTFTEDTDRGLIEVELTYECEKVRVYQIYQPDSDTLEIEVEDGDTGIDVELEDVDGNSETVEMATATVSTTKTDWESLTAIELSAETDGDVVVRIEGGEDLATIRGAEYYHPHDGSLEGDLGVPAIGAGSTGSAINDGYDSFIGATIERGGNALTYDISETVMAFENGYERTPRQGATSARVNEGNREGTVELDLIGWGASADLVDQALGGTAQDVVITTAKTEFTYETAVVSEPGEIERASDESAFVFEVTIQNSNGGDIALSAA